MPKQGGPRGDPMGGPMGPLGGPSGTPEVEQDWNKIGTRLEQDWNKKGRKEQERNKNRTRYGADHAIFCKNGTRMEHDLLLTATLEAPINSHLRNGESQGIRFYG